MNIEIVEIGPKRVDELSKVGAQAYVDHFSNIWTEAGLTNYLHVQYRPEKLADDIQRKIARYYIANQNEQTIGFMKLKLNSLRPADYTEAGLEIEKIYLLRESVGKGFGEEMMRFALAVARDTGQNFVWLDALKSNRRAIKFYERLGFVIVDEFEFATDKFKPDMFVMKYTWDN